MLKLVSSLIKGVSDALDSLTKVPAINVTRIITQIRIIKEYDSEPMLSFPVLSRK